jgi:hypothetical protein
MKLHQYSELTKCLPRCRRICAVPLRDWHEIENQPAARRASGRNIARCCRATCWRVFLRGSCISGDELSFSHTHTPRPFLLICPHRKQLALARQQMKLPRSLLQVASLADPVAAEP